MANGIRFSLYHHVDFTLNWSMFLYFWNKYREFLKPFIMTFMFIYFLLWIQQWLFWSDCASQNWILFSESQNSLMKLLNKYLLVSYFIILLFFHTVIHLLKRCNGLLLLCQIIISVLPDLVWIWLEFNIFQY